MPTTTATRPEVEREASAGPLPYQGKVTELAAMARCPKCKGTRRVTVLRVRWPAGKDRFGVERFHVRLHYPDLVCGCGRRYPSIQPIAGTLNPAVACTAKCQSATGHDCECSCGGKNHGNAHV